MKYVFKFGGSSLATIDKIKQVANFIKEIKNRDDLELMVVVSAMGKTTNKLIELANKLSDSPEPNAYNSLITCGENISSSLLAIALEEIGIPATALTAKDIKIYAKGDPKKAVITHIDRQRITEALNQNKVVVISGFQAINNNNNLVTLGRGGSDTSAVALGAVFNAPVKIFTDVDGYFYSNPNIFPNLKKLSTININSAIELANTGAQILDNRALEIAHKEKVNLSVLNSSNTSSGTHISYEQIANYVIEGVSFKNKMTFIKCSYKNNNPLKHLLNSNYFDKHQHHETLINNLHTDILITNAQDKTLKNLISTKSLNKTIIKPCEVVTIAGSGFCFHTEFYHTITNVLHKNKIKPMFISLSPTTLHIITKPHLALKLTNLIVQEFKLSTR